MNAPVSLIERLVRTTVGVDTHVPEGHRSAAILGAERSGTGTLIDAAGLVLTVNYVVLGAERVDVTLSAGDQLEGRVIAQDFSTGLGIVKIEGGGPYRPAGLRSSRDCAVGDEVVVITSVGGQKRRANDGWITALEAFDAYWEFQLERAIFTTAVNPGLGGAPLFDTRGNLVGVVALDLGEIGRFTLAIPVELFLNHREELLRFGHRVQQSARAWVGLYCYGHRGRIVIAGVLPGSPAEAAGLRAGDLLLAVHGKRVRPRGEL